MSTLNFPSWNKILFSKLYLLQSKGFLSRQKESERESERES